MKGIWVRTSRGHHAAPHTAAKSNPPLFNPAQSGQRCLVSCETSLWSSLSWDTTNTMTANRFWKGLDGLMQGSALEKSLYNEFHTYICQILEVSSKKKLVRLFPSEYSYEHAKGCSTMLFGTSWALGEEITARQDTSLHPYKPSR